MNATFQTVGATRFVHALQPYFAIVVRRLAPGFNLPLAIAIVTWAFNFVALKILYRDLAPGAVSLVRFAGMYGALAVYCKFRGLKLRLEPGDAIQILSLGFLTMGVYMVLFLEGTSRTSPSEAVIIISLSPIFAGFFAPLLRQERFTLGAFAGGLIGFSGVFVVAYGAGVASVRFTGDMLMLCSAALWAFSAVLTKRFLGRYDPVRLFTLGLPAGLVALVPYGYSAAAAAHWGALTVVDWLCLLHLALLSGALGFACFYSGVQQIGAAGALTYQYFTPGLTVVFAWLVLGSPILWRHLIGMAIVIAGVAISSHFRRMAQIEAPIVETAPKAATGKIEAHPEG